jgi:undecaprenyl pyrophosphate phosphatase UppP
MAVTTTTGIWLGIDPKLSFIYSLACELPLIVIAVVVALKKKTSQTASLLSSISPLQGAFFIGSSFVSYGGLLLSYHGFNNQLAGFVGFYLLGLSLFWSFYRQKQS